MDSDTPCGYAWSRSKLRDSPITAENGAGGSVAEGSGGRPRDAFVGAAAPACGGRRTVPASTIMTEDDRSAEVISLDAARALLRRAPPARRMTQAEVVAALRDRMLRGLGLDFVLDDSTPVFDEAAEGAGPPVAAGP
jgi:hypothetical protein